jgi:hypothetical protein
MKLATKRRHSESVSTDGFFERVIPLERSGGLVRDHFFRFSWTAHRDIDIEAPFAAVEPGSS